MTADTADCLFETVNECVQMAVIAIANANVSHSRVVCSALPSNLELA